VARPVSSNARCIKGCNRILEVKPKGRFTCEDVAVWCDVSRKYGYQIVTYGISNGYIDVSKKDTENNVTYYELRGFSREWLTRSWGNGSLVSNEQASSGDVGSARERQHQQESHIRDTTRAAIKASEQCLALLSKKASKRA
jgi:hypothetical protein